MKTQSCLLSQDTLVPPVSQITYVLVIEDAQGRRTINLEQMKYSLGRQSTNDIVIYSKNVSRKHATLIKKSNIQNLFSYWIFDGDLEGNKSHNGIFVNNRKCMIHELKDGDIVNLGCQVNVSYHVINQNSRSLRICHSSAKFKQIELEKSLITESHNHVNPLTGLPNAICFRNRFTAAINESKLQQKFLAVLLLEINSLALIEKSFGIKFANLVLQSYIKRLTKVVKAENIVAHWQKENEFVVLLSGAKDQHSCGEICNNIIQEIQQDLTIHNQKLSLKTYWGLSLYPQDGWDIDIILSKATTSLLKNKQKDTLASQLKLLTICHHNSQFSKIENLLFEGLEKHQFSLNYQPQINIKTSKIEGMEALLRWQHPKLGVIPPSQFIPWAEKTELIIPLSQWVLKTACKQNEIWQELGLLALPIAVNIAPKQLQNLSLIKLLTQVLIENQFNANLLEIEVPLAGLFQNLENSRAILPRLQQLGLKISVDDCGLTDLDIDYIHQFPVQKLKIAQALISQMLTNPKQRHKIISLLILGRLFDLKVVAEGVETQAQLDTLRSLDCEQMQGYRLSYPLNTQQATEFLIHHHP
jgi:diguanylate cyclase (GGDEF)-like protein